MRQNIKLFVFLVLIISIISMSYTSLLRLDFSGFNGLYITQKKNEQKIRWITNISDTGYYKVTYKNKVLTEGRTEYGKIHQLELNEDVPKEYKLEFGGQRTGRHSIAIKSITKQEKSTFKNVDSIYTIGDVHGEYDNLIQLLQKSNIIDNNLEWIGGKAHLVFSGDLFDRGKKVTKLLWFIYKLEQQAEAKGGKVHVILGNHEIMIMSKDLRYVSAKERGIAIAHKTSYDELFHPGYSVLGNWLKHKVSVLQIDDILFTHGGIIDFPSKSLKEFNSTAFDYMKETDVFLDLIQDEPNTRKYSATKWIAMRRFFYGQNTPYWFRGYFRSDTLTPSLEKTLRKFKASTHVVGHTAVAKISKMYNGKLIATDLYKPASALLQMIKTNNTWTSYAIDMDGNRSSL